MQPTIDNGTIASSGAVERILVDACASRSLLHMHLEGNENRKFVSRFHELDGQGGLIVETPLFDNHNATLSSSAYVTVSFVFKFNKYVFETRCLGPAPMGQEGVRLEVPQAIKKIELRNYYRLRLEDDFNMTASLSKGNLPDTPVEGRIVDVSEGGVSCEIPPSRGIEQGAWVDSVQFALPNGYVVVASGTIRRVSPVRGPNGESLWLCGLEFGHLDRTDRFALVDFIFEKQREEIRKKRHLL